VGVGVGAEDGLSGGALVHPWKWCSCWSWRWFNGGRGATTLGSGARDGGGIVYVCCCVLVAAVGGRQLMGWWGGVEDVAPDVDGEGGW